MSKLCLTCEDSIDSLTDKLFSEDEEVIPDWFKEIGNYSLLPPPLNRDSKYNLFKKKTISSCYPKDYNMEQNINTKKLLPKIKNTWVFYWAADNRNYLDTNYPQPAKAYGKFTNCGLTKIDNKHNILFKFKNPKPYQYKNIKYPPHLHFVYLLDNKLWNTKCSTLIITPEINNNQFKNILSTDKYLVICSLPKKIKIKEIENTHRISSEFSETKIIEELKKIIPKKFLKYYGNIKNIPLVIYGKNTKSLTNTELINKLRILEFINIIKFPGGLDIYNKYKK